MKKERKEEKRRWIDGLRCLRFAGEVERWRMDSWTENDVFFSLGNVGVIIAVRHFKFFSRKKFEFIIWCSERNVVKIGPVVQRKKVLV